MTTPFVLRGVFPVPKPCPKPSMGTWKGFQVEANAVIDLERAEVRGYQGLYREAPADPTQYAVQDTSEAFVVTITTGSDEFNPHPLGDVGAIKGILDNRLTSSSIEPVRTFTVALAGGGIGVAFEPLTFEPTTEDVQQIMGIVLLRSKQQDTMGVYDDPTWPSGSSITMTVNGQAV